MPSPNYPELVPKQELGNESLLARVLPDTTGPGRDFFILSIISIYFIRVSPVSRGKMEKLVRQEVHLTGC